MSLTDAQTVFAAIHEDALNDMLTAFCNARPRYLNYGSPAFVPFTTAAETQIGAIPFPGIPGGIQWRVSLSTPQVDLFKQTRALPPELALGPGQFSAALEAKLCIECRKIKIDPQPPRTHGGKNEENRNPNRTHGNHPLSELTCFELRVFAIGHLEHVAGPMGGDAIALAVDAVEIVDISPDGLESFLECLMFLILQAALAEIRLPLDALRVGAFSLIPVVGPLIEDDQIKARGTL